MIRVIKELIRDKRTLALMLIAPIIVLSLMNIVFDSNSETHVKIGFDQTVPSTLVDQFSSDEVTANKVKELSLNVQKLAAETGQKVTIEDFSVQNSYIYGGANNSFFDQIFPILIGFFVFFFVFLVSGIALLRERTSGTLERLLATPVKRSEIVMGYLVGYGIFAIIQTLIIVFFSIYVLDLQIIGSLWWVIGTNILIALTALVIGIFVSTFASSVFFSGLIALDSMASWVRYISYIFPLSYAGNALTTIMIKGQGWKEISFDLGILILFILVFTFLNIIGLKRYRKV